MRTWKSKEGAIELREGRWQEALADVATAEALITDPPYSDRTHKGQRTGSSIRTPTILYDALSAEGAVEIANAWRERVRHWAIVWSDHVGHRMHEEAWGTHWYTFAPVVWLPDLSPPRMSGDGPTCAAAYLMIARPRRRLDEGRTGSRPGVYHARSARSCDERSGLAGVKAIDGVRALIRDYTLKDDLIIDPFAGSGTTLLAAAIEGRRAIGAEVNPKTFDLAVKRLKAGWTMPLALS